MPDVFTAAKFWDYASVRLTGDTDCEDNVTLSHRDVATGHHPWARMTCDATHFHLET
jgi:hypothetical protein